MNRLALVLLSSPTLFGSMLSLLISVNPAHAAEPATSVINSCQSEPTSRVSRLTCARFSQTPHLASTANSAQLQTDSVNPSSSERPMLNFTEEESEAAVQLFGCDCLVCINAIRQMRGLAPLSS